MERTLVLYKVKSINIVTVVFSSFPKSTQSYSNVLRQCIPSRKTRVKKCRLAELGVGA